MTASTTAPISPTRAAGEEDIDLGKLVAALRRRWHWIAGGAALGGLLAAWSMVGTKPTYQGEFQIVMQSPGQSAGGGASALLSANPSLAALAGLRGRAGGDSMATEMAILNSPSVLLPVFEAVKAQKPPEVANRMRLQQWAASAITVENKKGTSVLNVAFRDTDAALVLPITRKLSDTYQSYSNRGRSRELDNMIAYLQEQITRIKPKADTSARAALSYGYQHGLGVVDGLPIAGTVAGSSGGTGGTSGTGGSGGTGGTGGTGGSVEAARTAAQQRVLALEVQIREAQKAGAGAIYFASQLGSTTDKSSTYDQLTSIETELAERRSRFKDIDPIVQRLQRERDTLVGYINEQTIALLRGELDLARAVMQSLNRPQEVLSRHRELTQEALRDEATLVNMQNQLSQFYLEQARQADPWELISNPTLLDKPVSTRPARTLALGLLAGLVLGSGTALLVDRRSGLVFSAEELQAELPVPLLAELHSEPAASLALLAQGPLAAASQVALIPLGLDADDDALQQLGTDLQEQLPNSTVRVSADLVAAAPCSHQLLVTRAGSANREQLKEVRQLLQLQSRSISGWLLLADG
jgi:uncharacterized protein involved in exopolysaccharide biosynthesis